MDRFWNKVDKNGPMPEGKNLSTQCWIWTAFKEKGYGQFGYEGKVWKAHRMSWLMTNGPISDGLCVLHTCDNRSCVNPDHLFLGTYDDNNKDRSDKNRSNGMHGRKDYIVTFPDGHEEIIGNMNQFSKQYGLYQCAMTKIAKGNRFQHKGFTCRYKE